MGEIFIIGILSDGDLFSDWNLTGDEWWVLDLGKNDSEGDFCCENDSIDDWAILFDDGWVVGWANRSLSRGDIVEEKDFVDFFFVAIDFVIVDNVVFVFVWSPFLSVRFWNG